MTVATLFQDVNQETGEDINPERSRLLTGGATEEEGARNPDRPVSMSLVSMPDLKEQRAVKRISSPEKWELNRLAAANVIDKSELPEFDDETGKYNIYRYIFLELVYL